MQTQISPRITPSVGLPILYLNHCMKWPVTLSQAFSFCAQILSTSDLLHAAPNFAKRTDSIHSRRLAGFPWCRHPSVAVNHTTLGRRGTKKHCSWQCLCVVSLYICRHGLNTGDVDPLVRHCREERGANTEPTGLGMERWCARCSIINDFSISSRCYQDWWDGMGS